MTTSKGHLDTVYPALLIILTNVAPHIKHISPSACSKVIQLFSSMSAPSFLLANETNHTLLASLLDFISAILEHGFAGAFSQGPEALFGLLIIAENPYLVYAILKYKDRFEAVRAFTLESGQQEIERQKEKRKAGDTPGDLTTSPTLSHSEEDLHAPSGARSPLTRIPEENSAFAIGDDDSDDEAAEGGQRTPSQSSPSAQTSRRPSFASTVDETSSQIRGISEKARGKLPAGRPSFSRQNSMTSQTSMSALFSATSTGFTPTVAWVSFYGYPSAVWVLIYIASLNLGCRSSLCTLCSLSSPPLRRTSPMQPCRLQLAQKLVPSSIICHRSQRSPKLPASLRSLRLYVHSHLNGRHFRWGGMSPSSGVSSFQVKWSSVLLLARPLAPSVSGTVLLYAYSGCRKPPLKALPCLHRRVPSTRLAAI